MGGEGLMALTLSVLGLQCSLLLLQWVGMFFLASRVALGFSSRWVLELGAS